MLEHIKKLLTPDQRLPEGYYKTNQHTANVFRYIAYTKRRQRWMMDVILTPRQEG